MTHTPGPWFINFDPETDERPLEIVTSDPDHRIAFPASNGKPADAYLIAAAPDLLAALKAIMKPWEASLAVRGRTGFFLPDQVQAAFDAIAKAERVEGLRSIGDVVRPIVERVRK